jgi:two-component system sensor histidine kinase CiaH
MIKSATVKLTLWYLGIIVLLSALFSVALYRESSTQLDENAAHQRNAITRLPLPLEFEQRRTDFLQTLDNQLDQDRQRIILRLLVLNLATLLLGGAASYLLARRTLRPIEDSLEAQGRFTADASHELRTPLTAMRAEIEVALRQKQLTPAEARELLGSNLEEIAKLEALSASLLKLAHNGGELDPGAITNVPVADIFAEATKRFEKLAAERGVQVEATSGPQTVAGDRDSLVELVAILLDNAIKYSPADATITLASDLTAHSVRLSVADHGAGIAAADIEHIFDRFYRADRSRSKDHVNGYGLGLSIAKRIVDLHHGTITVDSVPDKGSTFRVKLPMQYVAKKSLL